MAYIAEFDNFISEEEQLSTLEFIKNNEKMLVPISFYSLCRNMSSVPLYFLGAPVYPSNDYDKEYKAINNRVKDLDSFFLKNKVALKLEELFKKPVCQLENASSPGFHIFKKDPTKDKFFIIENYHVDVDIFKYVHFLKYRKDKIYSFNIVIETTEEGDTLDYKMDEEFLQINYKPRSMYIWEGKIIAHKIGDVTLIKSNDRRITYQGHFIETDDKLLMYW